MVEGKNSEYERPDGDFSGIVKRFKKAVPSGVDPITLGMIEVVYKKAIQYSRLLPGTAGWIMFFGVFTIGIFSYLGISIIEMGFDGGVYAWAQYSCFPIGAIFLYVGFYNGIKFFRLELFKPENEPIIFDKKNKMIYRIYKKSYPGLRGLLKPWPMIFAEHEWLLVDALHQAVLNSNGSIITRNHALIFLVRRSESDQTIVDSFSLSGLQMGEFTVPAVWEHIRQFMEKDGPCLPPGEAITTIVPPGTFLQTFLSVSPLGKNFWTWLDHDKFFLLLYYIFFPISFPCLALVGIFKFLSYNTSVPVVWPEHVLRNIE